MLCYTSTAVFPFPQIPEHRFLKGSESTSHPKRSPCLSLGSHTISLSNSSECEWPPDPPSPCHRGSLGGICCPRAPRDTVKMNPFRGAGEVQVSCTSLHAALTRSQPCPPEQQWCSSCHGELYSKIGALAPLFPWEDEDFVEFLFPFSVVPAQHQAQATMLSWTKAWCYLLILKIHEDKLISFLPSILHLKKWRWRVKQSAN